MTLGAAIAVLLKIFSQLLDLHSQGNLTKEAFISTLNQAVSELKDPPKPKE